MPSVDNTTLERLRRSSATAEDVWFLSGPTQSGEAVMHSPVDGDPYIVGRKTGVSLKLQFRTVSGNHAGLWIEKGVLHLKDLGSTNGTYVNGTRLEKGQSVSVREEDLILSLIHISEPTRPERISYAVFCLKKKK